MAYVATLEGPVILQEPHPNSSDLVEAHTRSGESCPLGEEQCEGIEWSGVSGGRRLRIWAWRLDVDYTGRCRPDGGMESAEIAVIVKCGSVYSKKRLTFSGRFLL